MKLIYRIILSVLLLHGTITLDLLAQNNKTNFNIEIKNSIGEPQKEAFIKISGKSDIYKPDSTGAIKFEYEVSQNYKRTASIYLDSDPDKPVENFTLEEENANLLFTIDTKDNLLDFKKGNSTFGIEGIVTNEEGEPIEGAVVSIQGTGRYATTDEIGLFAIEADYNHLVIIRANGMENMSIGVTPFLANEKEAYNIKMKPKGEDRIYTSVEKKPQYPGGMGAFKRYIDGKLVYPEQAKKDSIEGVVVMQFIVEKDGDITHPKIARSLEPSLDSIAMSLIKDMPRWIPGSDYGTVVRCKYSLPVAFKIPQPGIIKEKGIPTMADSIKTIKLRFEILKPNGLFIPETNMQNDTIDLPQTSHTAKVKKYNAFVRFFRRLFGMKD